jgi:cytochrome P450
VDLAGVDLMSAAVHATGDPHRIWREMRRRAPVCWQPVDGRRGFWSATTLADVSAVLRDHSAFTAQRGSVLDLLGADDPAGGRQLAVTDPPRHTAMRAPVQHALSMRAITPEDARIAAEVDRILAGTANGVFDLAELAGQLPMAVAGGLLGVDRQDWPRLTRLTQMAVAPREPSYQIQSDPDATLRTAHRELFAYFSRLVAQRERSPRDDLISLLLRIEVDGGRLDPEEVVANCYGLVLGANVTTPHVASAAVQALMGTGGWSDWAAHPDLLDSGVEEALRWSSPANHFMRYAVHDVVLGGAAIAAGDAVVAWIGSANRDESEFEDPFRFDIRRHPNRHVAFGVGPHYCVGHALARAGLRHFLAGLLRRFADFEPAGAVAHLHSNFIAGFTRLPVRGHAHHRVLPDPAPAKAGVAPTHREGTR